MPRKTAVDELQAQEVSSASPLRRSTRRTSTTQVETAPTPVTPARATRGRRPSASQDTIGVVPAAIGKESNSTDAPTTPGRVTRGRRASAAQDIEEVVERKLAATRGRKALLEEDSKLSIPSRRGRKLSTSSESALDDTKNDKPNAVRGRRSSATFTETEQAQVVEKPASMVRGRRKSASVEPAAEIADASSKTPARTTRRRTSASTEPASTTEPATPEKKTLRGRRASLDEKETEKKTATPARRATRGRQPSVNEGTAVEFDENGLSESGTNSETKAIISEKTPRKQGDIKTLKTATEKYEESASEPEILELNVVEFSDDEDVLSKTLRINVSKLTSIRKKKIEPLVAELDLSVINESIDDAVNSGHQVENPEQLDFLPVKSEENVPENSQVPDSSANLPIVRESSSIDRIINPVDAHEKDDANMELVRVCEKPVSNPPTPATKNNSATSAPEIVEASLDSGLIMPKNSSTIISNENDGSSVYKRPTVETGSPRRSPRNHKLRNSGGMKNGILELSESQRETKSPKLDTTLEKNVERSLLRNGSDGSFNLNLNVSSNSTSSDELGTNDGQNSSKESMSSDKENQHIEEKFPNSTVARISDEFKLVQKEYSFCEPMDLDQSVDATKSNVSQTNASKRIFLIQEETSVVFDIKSQPNSGGRLSALGKPVDTPVRIESINNFSNAFEKLKAQQAEVSNTEDGKSKVNDITVVEDSCNYNFEFPSVLEESEVLEENGSKILNNDTTTEVIKIEQLQKTKLDNVTVNGSAITRVAEQDKITVVEDTSYYNFELPSDSEDEVVEENECNISNNDTTTKSTKIEEPQKNGLENVTVNESTVTGAPSESTRYDFDLPPSDDDADLLEDNNFSPICNSKILNKSFDKRTDDTGAKYAEQNESVEVANLKTHSDHSEGKDLPLGKRKSKSPAISRVSKSSKLSTDLTLLTGLKKRHFSESTKVEKSVNDLLDLEKNIQTSSENEVGGTAQSGAASGKEDSKSPKTKKISQADYTDSDTAGDSEIYEKVIKGEIKSNHSERSSKSPRKSNTVVDVTDIPNDLRAVEKPIHKLFDSDTDTETSVENNVNQLNRTQQSESGAKVNDQSEPTHATRKRVSKSPQTTQNDLRKERYLESLGTQSSEQTDFVDQGASSKYDQKNVIRGRNAENPEKESTEKLRSIKSVKRYSKSPKNSNANLSDSTRIEKSADIKTETPLEKNETQLNESERSESGPYSTVEGTQKDIARKRDTKSQKAQSYVPTDYIDLDSDEECERSENRRKVNSKQKRFRRNSKSFNSSNQDLEDNNLDVGNVSSLYKLATNSKSPDVNEAKLTEPLTEDQNSVETVEEIVSAEELESEEDAFKENEFIDGIAEECEEDTPSEGSNDIIDEGESIGSSDSEELCDEDYDNDSFVCDDEEQELLSGNEYDLDNTKKEKAEEIKKSRIVDLQTFADDEIIILPSKKSPETTSPKRRSRIVEVSDSSGDELDVEADSENHTNESSFKIIEKIQSSGLEITSNLRKETESPIVDFVENATEIIHESTTECQDLSATRTNTNEKTTSPKRRRKSSINIHESFILDGSKEKLSKRINSLVESFCTSVQGEVSLNLSLEFEEKTDSSNIAVQNKTAIPSPKSIHIISDVKITPSFEQDNQTRLFESEAQPGTSSGSRSSQFTSDCYNNELNKSTEKLHSKSPRKRMSVTCDDFDSSSSVELSNKKRRLSQSLEEVSQTNKDKKKQSKRMKPKQTRVSKSDCDPSSENLRYSTFNLMNSLVTDVKNRPRRVMKPTVPNTEPNSSWISSPAKNLKPSRSLATQKEKLEMASKKFHPKDFKNQTLADSKRVPKVETTTLLKKRGAF